MNNLRWIMATEEEWNHAGLQPEASARRISMELPTGETKEYILQHYQLQSNSDEKYELLHAKLPSSAFVSDRVLQMILPVEES